MKNLKNLFSRSGKEKGTDHIGEGHSDSHTHSPNQAEIKGYYCPMRCEGDKVYAEPGRCPVCNMKLIPVGD